MYGLKTKLTVYSIIKPGFNISSAEMKGTDIQRSMIFLVYELQLSAYLKSLFYKNHRSTVILFNL